MSSRRSGSSLAAPALAVGAVAVVAAAAVTLATLAVLHVRPTPVTGTVAPVPTFVITDRTPSPTADSAIPGAAPGWDRAQELFLSATGDTVWRASAGSCGTDAEPLLEQSLDAGATWSDVTPRAAGVEQILGLTATDGVDPGRVVAAVGEGCEAGVVRSWTEGQFWEAAPDELAAARYVDPGGAATVHLANASVPAPCAAPRGLRASADTVALVCDGVAWWWQGSSWSALPVEDVSAVAVSSDDVFVAAGQAGCDGVAVVRATTAAVATVGCVPGIDGAAPIALAADGDRIVLWAGGGLTSITAP